MAEEHKGEAANTQQPMGPEIPKEGSLGIMAAGYLGIQLWRRTLLGLDPNDPRIIGPIINGRVLPINPPKKQDVEKE